MEQKLWKELLEITGESHIRKNEPMSRHTTFRIGGPADLYIEPDRMEKIAPLVETLRQYSMPYFILGNGSNLLVSDSGFRGAVIQIDRNLSAWKIYGDLSDLNARDSRDHKTGKKETSERSAGDRGSCGEETILHAEAGALLSKLSAEACRRSLTGLEFASGIPGTLGGACIMNAGAYGGEMKDILQSVTVLDENGSVRTIHGKEMLLGYRISRFQLEPWIVLSAELRLRRGDGEEITAHMEELKEKRTAKQPLEYPSAGSTFKRPEGYYAGALIDEAGLRGYCVGGAQVSEKHCGFVINRGGATAEDVRQLIAHIQDIVEKKSGVHLEPEIRMLGFDEY